MLLSGKSNDDMLSSILSYPQDHTWTASGLGLIRCYLSEDRSVRLHIWNSDLRVPGVSMIHTHPWHLFSTIVCGCIVDNTYEEADASNDQFYPYFRRKMRCGDDVQSLGKDAMVSLIKRQTKQYYPEDSYRHCPEDIHETEAAEGTVTVMTRVQSDRDYAYIYWPGGTNFGDSYQRPATENEIIASLMKIQRH